MIINYSLDKLYDRKKYYKCVIRDFEANTMNNHRVSFIIEF